MTLGAGDQESVIVGEPPRRWFSGQFPFWLVAIFLILAWLGWSLLTRPRVTAAFDIILPSLKVTIRITALAFVFSLGLGLVAGLGRIARNGLVRNLAITYIEFIRGIPIVVLILMIAFVLVPMAARFFGFSNQLLSQENRFIIALSIIYGAFMAEIFRAGVESIPVGQMEAARSLGMSHFKAMTFIVLPQAVRNVLPALGNDLIALLKDSALATLLGVGDLTQAGRLYAGRTFRFREVFTVLTFFYLTMTILLSLLVAWMQRRLARGSARG
jgi:polar amino acid transport system permease protein